MPHLRFSAITLALTFAFALGAGPSARAETVTLVIDAPLKGPAKLALADFEAALAARKIDVRRVTKVTYSDNEIVVGTVDDSAEVRKCIEKLRIDLGNAPESYFARHIDITGRFTTGIMAGRDDRGLSYALLELTHACELEPVAHVFDEVRGAGIGGVSPALAVRSVSVHPMNADLEAEWYYSEEYWRGYFKMLATNRFNRFLLTFSDQTNYLCPLYAHTVEVPEYPQVSVRGLDAAGKKRNLDMLRRISEMAAERGIDFTLAIWMQSPVPRYSGEVKVAGLPEGLASADYCARGLRMILDACPAISGIQFRLNSEAGVKEEEQTEFYRPLFKAIADCGRPMRLDLRYKGLQESTIAAARELKLDLTVSTKFWAEHFGLPYHPTEVDKHYRKDRYSFGSMLKKPRDYRVVYQLWTAGSMRILPWGDPAYVKQFVESCKLGDGEGFEVFAPLTNKGYGDAPGNWRLLKNPADEWYRWEYERYWYFYLLFGQIGFDSSPRGTDWYPSDFGSRFNGYAEYLAKAYHSASIILPLITAAHLPSASEWGYWPEMDTGGKFEEYMRTPPGDPSLFYAIRSWKRTPEWAWDEWDGSIPGYVDDAIAGQLSGKYTPHDVRQKLMKASVDTKEWVSRYPKGSLNSETRAAIRDLTILAELAEYHSQKIYAATQLAFFEQDKNVRRLTYALFGAQEAAAAWRRIVKLTDGVYHENLVFGITPDSPRSTLGRHHSGHWKDRLPEVLEDLAYVEGLVKKYGAPSRIPYPLETFLGDDKAFLSPGVETEPITLATAGRDLSIKAKGGRPRIVDVRLHYRRLDQSADWTVVSMKRSAQEQFLAIIPGAAITAKWDLQYYIEYRTTDGGGRWPNPDESLPFAVIKTVNAAVP